MLPSVAAGFAERPERRWLDRQVPARTSRKPAEQLAAEQAGDYSIGVLADARILVVEDDPDMAENIAEVIGELGASVEIALSAEAALELVSRTSFDGVISDFRLPGLGGVDLIRELRQRGIVVPVVMMSGYMDHRAIEAAEAAGALDILAKPIDLRRLLNDVRQFARPQGRVLIVEDNAELAENLVEALRAVGLSPIVAGTGAQALEQRALHRVAIVDIRLPDSDGIEIAQRLAARDPRIQIIFLTGYAEHHRAQLENLCGSLPGLDPADLCVSKPCDVGALAARVRAAAVG